MNNFANPDFSRQEPLKPNSSVSPLLAESIAPLSAAQRLIGRVMELSEGGRPRDSVAERKIAAALRILETEEPQTTQLTLEERKQQFVDRYQIRTRGASAVQLTIPKGSSRIQFIEEAQSLILALTGLEAVESVTVGFWKRQKSNWNEKNRFASELADDHTIAVSTHLQGKKGQGVGRQLKNIARAGLTVAKYEDLAVAHLAQLAATGTNLFFGERVIVAENHYSLFFGHVGLCQWSNGEGHLDRGKYQFWEKVVATNLEPLRQPT